MATSHGQLIQRSRAQDAGQDRKIHLGAVQGIGEVTGEEEMVEERYGALENTSI